jgi:hypothetical protein
MREATSGWVTVGNNTVSFERTAADQRATTVTFGDSTVTTSSPGRTIGQVFRAEPPE